VNPAGAGTKAAALYTRMVKSGETITIDLRLAAVVEANLLKAPFAKFDSVLRQRQQEADEFYDVVLPKRLSADEKLVALQAFAGMLWSKQYYHYVVSDWLEGDPTQPTSWDVGADVIMIGNTFYPRRDFHAGQMGVSMVCFLGSRFIVLPRPMWTRICQRADPADDA
jgi:hypothetical protein